MVSVVVLVVQILQDFFDEMTGLRVQVERNGKVLYRIRLVVKGFVQAAQQEVDIGFIWCDVFQYLEFIKRSLMVTLVTDCTPIEQLGDSPGIAVSSSRSSLS